MSLRVLAVDLGATSARVCAVTFDDDGGAPPELDVLHRYHHAPVRHDDGSLRWDWGRLLDEVTAGLSSGVASGPVASIGVDTWGVDYGLLDSGGELLSPPHSYRSTRTDGWRDTLDRLGGAEAMYATTGIQIMPINTVFQLAAHDPQELARARRFVMLPELVVHALCGEVSCERTAAGTTALVDVGTGTWSHAIVDGLGLDPQVLSPIRAAGARVGTWRDIPVHLVGGHDTASAVAALPGAAAPGRVFVSSGTWLLVGRERDAPDTTPAAAEANFSNEPGVFGGFRFLKNVMGLGMLEQCREAWGGPTMAQVAEAAGAEPAAAAAGRATVDALDRRFVSPPSMDAEVREAAGLQNAPWPVVARCIFDSIAEGAARVVRELEGLTGEPTTRVTVLGGGGRVPLLPRLLEEATGAEVETGPVEATALGNALAQAVALGRFAHLDDARLHLAAG